MHPNGQPAGEMVGGGVVKFCLKPGIFSASRAFSLIEMLVVMAVLAVLAALIFPAVISATKAKILRRTHTELEDLQSAIASYKAKFNHYPPDNADSVVIHQLYYELAGTRLTNGTYVTLDGSAHISAATLNAAFGPNVSGFVNCAQASAGDENAKGRNFLTSLQTSRAYELTREGPKLLVGAPWQKGSTAPFDVDPTPIPTLNPWRYNSSNPSHNPKSYDLWIDVRIQGRVYRVCNWSRQPLAVAVKE